MLHKNIFRLHKGSLSSSLDGLSNDIYFPNLVISLQISYPSCIYFFFIIFYSVLIFYSLYILWFPRSVVWRHDPLQFVFSEHAPNCQSRPLTINFSSFHLVRFCHSFTRCELKSFTKESSHSFHIIYSIRESNSGLKHI